MSDDHEETRKTPFPAHLRSREVSGFKASKSRSRPVLNPADGLSCVVADSMSAPAASEGRLQAPLLEEPRAESTTSTFTGNVSPMTRPSDSCPDGDDVMSVTRPGAKRPSCEMDVGATPSGGDASTIVTGNAMSTLVSTVLDGPRLARAPPRSESSHALVGRSRPAPSVSLSSRPNTAPNTQQQQQHHQQQQQSQSSRGGAQPTKSAMRSVSSVAGRHAMAISRSQAPRESTGTSLVALSAELDFQGKEITQLVGALVKRQQCQLRELFDELAAARVDGHDALVAERSHAQARVDELKEEHEASASAWADERQRLADAEQSRQVLLECLQGDLKMKSESVKLLTEQLNSAQARLDTANHRINALTSALASAEARNKSSARQESALAERSVSEANAAERKAASAKAHELAFVLTGFRTADRLDLEKQIRALGGAIVSCPSNKPLPANVTHVVCGSLTPKAIAGLMKSGTVICPKEFVSQSAAKGAWVPASSVRSVVGDVEEWLDNFPAIAAAAPSDRDPGTAEVCGVLEQCGMRIEALGARSQDGLVAVPQLPALLNDMKPAFLTPH